MTTDKDTASGAQKTVAAHAIQERGAGGMDAALVRDMAVAIAMAGIEQPYDEGDLALLAEAEEGKWDDEAKGAIQFFRQHLRDMGWLEMAEAKENKPSDADELLWLAEAVREELG